MSFDFERDFGINAAYVQELYEAWKRDASQVDPEWQQLFEGGAPPVERAQPGAAAPAPARPAVALAEARAEVAGAAATEGLEPLRGVAGRIAQRMTESLEVPTATSVRTLSAKVLQENRAILNEHLEVRALGKASFTHLIAFAIVRALSEMPRMQSAYVETGGKAFRRVPQGVNLGLAIDVASDGARGLVVPVLKEAQALHFQGFREAYDELVERARAGRLGAEDFQGLTVSLTNPGGFGTTLSVPRLMAGQGLIVGVGAIGIPPEAAGMSRARLAELALGPVLTLTSTYDHRVIQGAESALFLRRVDQLLQGEDGFYEEVFRRLRVPWTPLRSAVDESTEARVSDAELQSRVWEMINAYRVRGHRLADLDPLEYRPDPLVSLDPSSYGFTVWDLDRTFLCAGMCGAQEMTLRRIFSVLRRAYCRRWTVEYMHITDRGPKFFIRDRMEDVDAWPEFQPEDRVRILEHIARAENFERFLHTRYVGNKRFSLEGADTLIPVLAGVIERAGSQGVERVVIGMAHRGRLNVLANILGKSYEEIFREFEGVLLPLTSEGSGDVKYHRGQRGRYRCPDGREVEVYLSPNPSHLEAVDPVVCGIARASQDELGDAERKRVLAILIHGDAAFSGQGVVAETLNMSALRAYSNGGTVHVVVNNQIGFTAGPRDLRSTYYCTDVAKSIQAPILHANGDYPESVLRAAHLAVDYQRAFGRDVVVDMVCYRRRGHNEGDEPEYTQPLTYARIKTHPTVREIYTDLLIRRGNLERAEADRILERLDEELNVALHRFQAEAAPEGTVEAAIPPAPDDPADYAQEPSPPTGVARERLVAIVDRTNAMPAGHIVHPKLLRQLRRREQMVRGEQELDWGAVEVLAFGSLIEDGVSVRLAGQDSGRGTFSHRHAVIRDQRTEEDYLPLRSLARAGVTFEAWDSLLSEEAALGFEYGYSIGRPGALVLWEAQFGDFSNGAQIPIDQFVFAGETKWKQRSGVTLLLPHGYDGQGPEHSSARPERYLAMCSGGNATVANCSTTAQYFHLLRRQGLAQPKRPLVVLTPKSLLRDKRSASPVEELTRGSFREVLPDARPSPERTRRAILCSGKVYYALADEREERGARDVALVRVEQLYPFPRRELVATLDGYGPALDVVWCQEEPRNMGAWPFVLQRFADLGRAVRYVGRAESASPATGSYRRHLAEEEAILRRAFAAE